MSGRTIAGLRKVEAYELCDFCGRPISEHQHRFVTKCEVCPALVCEFSKHRIETCSLCGHPVCSKSVLDFEGGYCADCGKYFCPTCRWEMSVCIDCGLLFCPKCFDDHREICGGDDE